MAAGGTLTRRICVVTGSRADYGHLAPVMRAIAADPALTLQVVAVGQHLAPRFGETWKAIVADGFALDARVDIGLDKDTPLAIAEATGRAVGGLAQALARLTPDIVLVLGDRFEILAAGVAALILNVPLAHIHGGELTEAAMDDAIRHALTKMAALHFAAAQGYADRLVQMGEDPARVIVSGAPGLDQIATLAPMTAAEIGARVGIAVGTPLFLVTYHPVTLKAEADDAAVQSLLEALAAFPEATVIFTGVNSDPGHRRLQAAIDAFVARDPAHRAAVASLGQRGYLSAMRLAAAVIGNSSSGLIEAPALGIPTVNIGPRQQGRLRSPGVIDCDADAAAVRAAIAEAMTPAARTRAAAGPAAYGRGGASALIVEALKRAPLAELRTKRFHDILRR